MFAWFVMGLASAAPVELVHQARVLDAFGEPVDSEVELTVRIWASETAPSTSFAEAFDVTPVDGYASVRLGADALLLDDSELHDAWVDVLVDGNAIGSRKPLASVPMAAVASEARSIPALATPPACAATDVGTTYVDTTTNRVMVCLGANDWQAARTGGSISSNTTWTIGASGADFTSLDAALDAAQEYTIEPDARLTLSIADGTYAHSGAIDVEHPDGTRLHIVGNKSNPENVVLSWSGLGSGLVLGEGFSLAELDGMTVRGDSVDSQHGFVVYGTMSDLGSAIRLEGWTDVSLYVIGGRVRSGVVHIEGVYGVAGGVGIHVRHGGEAILGPSVIQDIGGLCVMASLSSYLTVSGSTVSNCATSGIQSRTGSTVIATSTIITGHH